MPDWARDYFERGYAERWGLPPVTDPVRRQVAGLCRLIDVDSSAFVVDIACGHGRHALAFAERGHDVVGIDFAVALLTRARQLGAELKVPAHWVRGDMRRLPLESGIAGVAILTDSCGLFETDEDNEAVLQEAALYRIDELQKALERHGLSRSSVFASPEGTRFDSAHSPTMWILAQRND